MNTQFIRPRIEKTPLSRNPGSKGRWRAGGAGLGVALVLALAGAGWGWWGPGRIDRGRVYRMGYGQDEPMHFRGPGGQPTGLAVDIVKAAAERRRICLEWVPARDPGEGGVDLWVLKSVIPGQATELYFTAPYLQAESCFLVKADSPVGDLPDLAGARISYVDFAVHRATLPQLLETFAPVPTGSSREAIEEMLAGRADAAYIGQYNLFSTLLGGESTALRILPTRSPTRQMALAARPENAAVADEIRAGMQDLVGDGTLSAITQRWIFFPNLTADIIGDSAQEHKRKQGLVLGITVLSGLLILAVAMSVLASRRKAQWQRSEKKYRELHESMTDAFARFDLEGRIVETNPAFCELLGYSGEELKTLTHADLTPAGGQEMDRKVLAEEVMPQGFSAVYEKQYRRADGTLLAAELRLFLLRKDSGEPAGTWAIVRDITERKKAEAERERLHQQLVQSQKMETVGRLAGGVAHDFNNMLQAILGNALMALRELPAGMVAREYLQEIQTAAQRSADLTRQLLAFARKQTIAPKVISMNEMVEGLLPLLRRLIGSSIEICWRPGVNLWWVRMDPSQVDQILTNLLVNARDAMGGAGQVVLETENVVRAAGEGGAGKARQGEEWVQLTIRDNGSGMDRETLNHLFEPFFTTKAIGAGTGLGLSTVYGIVSQNGGQIEVESEPGVGSVFRIYLPRCREEVSSGREERAVAAGGSGTVRETILLVEDEAIVLRVCQMMLSKLGYRVLTATSPAEALAKVEQNGVKIDLVVTDVMMPGMNGSELAGLLQRRFPGLRRIFISGYDANVIAPGGELEPGVAFLSKPFTPQDLVRLIQKTRKGEREEAGVVGQWV